MSFECQRCESRSLPPLEKIKYASVGPCVSVIRVSLRFDLPSVGPPLRVSVIRIHVSLRRDLPEERPAGEGNPRGSKCPLNGLSDLCDLGLSALIFKLDHSTPKMNRGHRKEAGHLVCCLFSVGLMACLCVCLFSRLCVCVVASCRLSLFPCFHFRLLCFRACPFACVRFCVLDVIRVRCQTSHRLLKSSLDM